MTCSACRQEINAWLDSNPTIVLGHGIRIAENAAYDGTPAGFRDKQRARAEDWRHLVRFQIGLIRHICDTQHRQELAA